MSTEENKTVSRRFHAAFDKGNQGPQALYEELASNFVAHFPGVPGPLDREGFRQLGNVFTSAFPQSQTTIDDEIAEGDKVVSRWTYRAVHRGEFQGIPPTGKQVTMTGLTLLRIAGGKIVEHWVELDQLGLLQQLGVVPPAQETGA
jgi:predicted ester cyclase